MQEEIQGTSTVVDWVLFLVSLAAVVLLLMYKPEFFWALLPFPVTYAVKALNMM